VGKRFSCFLLAVVVGCAQGPLAWAVSQNAILFVGDGMGFEHVDAAGMYGYGEPGTLSFEQFPYRAEVTTHAADNAVTDSAASATAMATGHKVNLGVISMEIPGTGNELKTILELFRDDGRRTGLVTTTYITHATPAAFGAHEPSRNNYSQIAGDYLNQTRPNVMFGGGGFGMSPAAAVAAGYTVMADRAELLALETGTETHVSGQFGVGNLPYEFDGLGALPSLSEATATALAVLESGPDGFFLLVEGGRIDHAAHANDLDRCVHETLALSNAVEVAVDWAGGRGDTLIVVTADHETGGLHVLANNGQGSFPSVSWSSTDHTDTNVPIYAWGQDACHVAGVMDNTDVFTVLDSALVPVASPFGLLICVVFVLGAWFWLLRHRLRTQ
jgi:alkaline phosphatase